MRRGFSRARAVLVALVFVALGAASRAHAQEEPRPSLAGHTFVSTDLVPDAFVRAFLRTSLGYAGSQSIDYPPIVIGGDTVAVLNGSLTYATLGIEYQGVLRDWIAAGISLGLTPRLGTQAASLISEGVTVSQGYEFAVLARLRQTPHTSLCGTLGVSNGWVTVIDVEQFAEDVANGVPNAKVIDSVPTVRSTAGLRFGWAASRTFGVTLLGQTSYGDAPRRSQLTSWGWDMGASVDYDLAPTHGIPLGTALAYRISSQPGLTSTDNGNTSQTVLRIAYTRSHDLIALDVLGVFDRRNSLAEAVWAGGVAFSMRTYF